MYGAALCAVYMYLANSCRILWHILGMRGDGEQSNKPDSLKAFVIFGFIQLFSLIFGSLF